MALSATVFRGTLTVSDLDRNHFETHTLTVARHPSETNERMMVRVLAYAWAASLGVRFGPGLSEADVPDLSCVDDTGRTTLWIEVGLPDARHLGRALSRADRLVVFAYGRTPERWWSSVRPDLPRNAAIEVLVVSADDSQALAALAERTMTLHCTLQEGQIWFGNGTTTLSVELARLE